MPIGTILDPATTRRGGRRVCPRSVPGPGNVPVQLRPSPITLAACDLNILPAGRLDANAIKLLNLYPAPTSGCILSNFTTSPAISENRNAFDTRMDLNLSDKNQIFYRFSYVDDPQFIPGIFGGVADGGGFAGGSSDRAARSRARWLGRMYSLRPWLTSPGLGSITCTRHGFRRLLMI